MVRVYSSIVLILIGLSVVIPCHAQESDKDKAKEAFRLGKELYLENQFAEASLKFREAYKYSPIWKLMFNIGQSEASAKRYGLALEAMEAYLSQGGDDIAYDRQDEVRAETQRLRSMVGYLEIEAPDDAEVVIDGVNRGVLPLPGVLPLSSGMLHRVTVSLNGQKIKTRIIKVMVGQTTILKFEAPIIEEPAPVAKLPATAETPLEEKEPKSEEATLVQKNKGSQKLRKGGWITTGIGGAILAGAVVTGVMAIRNEELIEKNCDNGKCTAEWEDTVDKRDALVVTTNVLLISGGVIATTGIVLLILSLKKKETINKDVSVIPMIGPTVTGAVLNWRF